MRRLSLLGTLLGANFATVGLGKYIFGDSGKLAVSNISPVVFLFFALPMFYLARRSVSRSILGFLLMFNACAWLSFLIFAFRYGWDPNLPVLAFQEIEIVFAVLVVWRGRLQSEEFRVAARYGIICSALISVWYGMQQVRVAGWLFLTFSMDDKSQAAVLFCCEAFILLQYFGGLFDVLIAGILMIMSLMTLSRLPVFFIPIIFLSLARRSSLGAAIVGLAACGALVVYLAAGDSINQLFKVLDRLSSVDTVTSDSATSAHLLLLETALKMKFTDLYAFFAGTGPGNFSKALTSFPISTAELEAVDPSLISEARRNRAPMHSTPVSFLLDYNIAMFCLLGYLLMKAVRYLLAAELYMEVMFFGTLFAASMFYSLHNKPYLFLLCAAIAVLMSGRGVRTVHDNSVRIAADGPHIFDQATMQNDTNR